MVTSTIINLKESLKSARKRYLDTGKIAKSVFVVLAKDDPSPTKKYVEWTCKQFLTYNNLSSEMLKDIITLFDKVVKTGYKLPSKDINAYNYYELEDALEGFDEYEQTQRKIVKRKDVELWYENDKCYLYFIKSKKACQLYGAHTEWCITSREEDHWENYNKQFFFLYLISKETNEDKYAFAISYNIYNSLTVEAYNSSDDKIDWIEVLQNYNVSLQEFEKIIKTNQTKIKEYKLHTALNELIKNDDGTYSVPEDPYRSGRVYKVPPILVNSYSRKLRIKYLDSDRPFYTGRLLKSLEGCPQTVRGTFSCANASLLASLEGCPKTVTSNFTCAFSSIKNLKGMGVIYYSVILLHNDKLMSLEGSPKRITLNFSVEHSPWLSSLKGGPERVNGYYAITNTSIENLEGLPKYIGNSLTLLENSNLKTLAGLEQCELIGSINFSKKSVNEPLKEEIQKYRGLGYNIKVWD